eukprot:TRINITY_DN11385_c0_g1_i1.p1 TRINITY_DN11385_c0_g1~~TRINITY_DN11385_c0_g1_i1.p1  ORF type:complete len:277 (+),score=55.33 TRINITY_DN11385_c0_g1_i1:76-906(+)
MSRAFGEYLNAERRNNQLRFEEDQGSEDENASKIRTWDEVSSGPWPPEEQLSHLTLDDRLSRLLTTSMESPTDKNESNISKHKLSTSGTFLSDMTSMVNSPEFSDVQFRVGDEVLYGHKNILAARSLHFRNMFKSGMKEASEGLVHVTDVSYATLSTMLTFLYTDQLNIDPNTAVELLQVSEKYQLDELKAATEDFIRMSIESDNVIDLLMAADMHNARKLRKACVKFAVRHFSKVAQTRGFAGLVETGPHLLLEISQAVAKRVAWLEDASDSLFD